MESKNLGYSLKNIPIPSKASYLKSMMVKLKTLSKESVGKHIDNPMMRDDNNYTNYGLRSNISPPSEPSFNIF